MNTAYLLTGGNMGNKKETLLQARCLLEEHCGRVIRCSAFYETAAWGNTNQPGFLNQALELNTPLNARQLVRKILKLEKMMGRIRNEKMGPRNIDIDILLFNHEVHTTRFLIVPHPQLPFRRFALTPLAEIAPLLVHPLLHKTVAQLLEECTDRLEVKKLFA